MKHENFKQVKSIVETIDKYQQQLHDISRVNATVVISTNHGTIFTIGADSDSEHPYADGARILINAIKEDLQRRIDQQKSILDPL